MFVVHCYNEYWLTISWLNTVSNNQILNRWHSADCLKHIVFWLILNKCDNMVYRHRISISFSDNTKVQAQLLIITNLNWFLNREYHLPTVGNLLMYTIYITFYGTHFWFSVSCISLNVTATTNTILPYTSNWLLPNFWSSHFM